MTTRRCRRFTVAFKKRVALEALRGDRTVREIAVRHQIHPTQVAAWKRQAVEGLDDVFAGGKKSFPSDHDSLIRDLQAKIGELTVDRDFFASTQFRVGTGGKPVGGPGVKGGRSPAEWTLDARTHEGHAWFGSKAAECCFRPITAWETPSWRTRYSEPRSA